MYHIYRNNVISINRGDYLETEIKLLQGRFPFQKQIEIQDGDTLYFGLMHNNEPFERSLLKIEYTKENINEDGNLILEIEPEDTMLLFPGVYYYEVRLLTEDSKIITIVPRSKFIIID